MSVYVSLSLSARFLKQGTEVYYPAASPGGEPSTLFENLRIEPLNMPPMSQHAVKIGHGKNWVSSKEDYASVANEKSKHRFLVTREGKITIIDKDEQVLLRLSIKEAKDLLENMTSEATDDW